MNRDLLLEKIDREITRTRNLHDLHTGDHNETARLVLKGVENGMLQIRDIVDRSDSIEASQLTTYSVFNDRPASSFGTFVPKGSVR